jgi:hypothetical protein
MPTGEPMRKEMVKWFTAQRKYVLAWLKAGASKGFSEVLTKADFIDSPIGESTFP